MKKLAALILAALAACAMMVPASAGNPDDTPEKLNILKGTPVVDGVLDDIYTQSEALALENINFYAYGGFSGDAVIDATAYFLWDDSNVYACIVVEDDDVYDVGAAVYEAKANNWQADATELWYNEGNGPIKIHADAYGNAFFIDYPTGAEYKASFDAADCENAAALTEDGYIIEYSMPLANIGAGAEIGVSMQVNDQQTEGVGFASGWQNADSTLVLSAEEVELPEPEVTETAPQTFDAGVIAAVAAVISAAGYAVSKKR